MRLGYQEFPANADIDVTFTASSGMNDEDLTYLKFRENLPAIQDTNLNLLTIIEEVRNILEVFDKGIFNLNSPSILFTQDHMLNLVEIAGGKQTRPNPPLDDEEMHPLLTQPPSQSTPPVDSPDVPDLSLLLPHKDMNNVACLDSERNHPIDRITAADEILFGIYQDCLHQNPCTYLDWGIEDYGKWQKRW